jgi:hypothetical protein
MPEIRVNRAMLKAANRPQAVQAALTRPIFAELAWARSWARSKEHLA